MTLNKSSMTGRNLIHRIAQQQMFKRIRLIPCAFLIWSVSASAALSNPSPIVLTDTQLDAVNAGYVLLVIDARASAQSGNPVVATMTLTSVEVGTPQDDGYIYTVAEGHGYAYAGGEIVLTSVDSELDTDEEFVSSNMNTVSNQSGRDYQMLLPTRTSIDNPPANERLEFVTVRVVTRRPAPVN